MQRFHFVASAKLLVLLSIDEIYDFFAGAFSFSFLIWQKRRVLTLISLSDGVVAFVSGTGLDSGR